MGQQDTVTAKYMRKNQVFADAFNFYVYNGEQVINPDNLVELDTKEIEVPYGGSAGANQPIQRTRDVIKSLIAMTDGRVAYIVLGIENQSHIHYAMPVRNMVYDALHYTKQVEEAIQSHKKSNDYTDMHSDEFLSGFMKSDHLIPVLTLVIYWGSKSWDAPMSIHEMYKDWDNKLMTLVPDYRINLIEPATLNDEDFDKFQSSLKEVLSFIKYSNDKEMLRKHVLSNDNFRHLGKDEVNVLNACMNAGIKINKNKEGLTMDMCKALQDIKEEGIQEGTIKAEKNRLTDLAKMVTNLMQNMQLTSEAAMDVLGISEKDRKIITPLL